MRPVAAQRGPHVRVGIASDILAGHIDRVGIIRRQRLGANAAHGRIERAKALLVERSVTEVALAVGFAETSSFSAGFRNTAGCSPSEYRRGLG